MQGELRLEEQCEWYRAMFEACKKRPWLRGFALWEWAPKLPSASEAWKDDSYEICEKPVQVIIKRFYEHTNGSGHGALAGVLKALNADVLICGGIGGGAQTALAAAGIKLFGGVSGDADEAVEAFINETLDYNPDVKCSHHEHSHGEGHTCGEHGCGSHSCH